MKVAITGAGGQLGSQLVERFGPDAIALDLPEFDMTDRAAFDRLARLGPDVVINTAGHTAVDRAESEPELAYAVNVEGVAALVDVCRQLGAALVQISTDYIFGGDVGRTTPYRETDRPAPLGVYGQTKLEAERLVAACPRHLIVRTSGLFGPAAPRGRGNFVATMLRLAAGEEPIRVVDDQRSTPSYTPHVARAIEFLVRSGCDGIYHVVNRGASSWYELAAELFRLIGNPVELVPIGLDQYAAAARRPGYSVLDTSRYDALPGRWPLPDWHDALVEHIRREGLVIATEPTTTEPRP
ncbi:MAG: dTDP-4-dehydrorhamnose reductase [Pirellulales bacterium]|nr:dTDP-4-dehydrorhamnose reductase [Pirellulales bacterium]